MAVAEKVSAVLFILGLERNLRDCENGLIELFEHQSFRIVTRFPKNHDILVWCTKLMRSDTDEDVGVEAEIREKRVGWRELAGHR